MSAKSNRLYNDPRYQNMRENIEAFAMLGCTDALAIVMNVSAKTIDKWRLGVTVPEPMTRDRLLDVAYLLCEVARRLPKSAS